MAVAHTNRAFTLIEMLVVIGIITVVSSLVFANNNRFGGQVQLQNLAYDIALTIREAQVYGISVQRFGNFYAPAYGMHFAASSPGGYVLFADVLTPRNGLYDCPNPGTANCELVQSTTIQTKYKISAICATPSGGTERCGLSSLDITFQRPDPDAFIRSPDITGLSESARIEVMSPQGSTHNVTVGLNGQIAVQ